MPTEKLISVVYPRRALWDQKDKNNHNRYYLDKLRDQVAKELNMTRKEVRNKWKNLRDKFRAELQKKPKPKSGAGTEEYEESEGYTEDSLTDETDVEAGSSWQYFESLLFLKDQFIRRPSKGNLTVTIETSSPLLEDPAIQDPNEDLFENGLQNPSPDIPSHTVTPCPSLSATSGSNSSRTKS